MATAISDFYEPMRLMLDDMDASAQQYEAAHLLAAVKAVVRGGMVSGVTVSNDTLEPTIPDGALWGSIFLKATRAIMTPGAGGGSFATRAFRHMDRGTAKSLLEIEHRLHELEDEIDGGVIRTYQDLASYLASTTGRNEYWQLVQVTQQNPVNRIDVNVDGTNILS